MPTATYIGPTTTPADAIHAHHVRSHPAPPAPAGSSPSALLSAIRDIFPSTDSSASAAPALHRRTYELTDRRVTSASPHGLSGTSVDEEIAWFGRRVVWCKGGMVFRTFSYKREKEDVRMALFAWFSDEVDEDERTERVGTPAESSTRSAAAAPAARTTFGPFSTSQHATWSDPRRKRRDRQRSTTPREPKRCLVVFLQSQARVYRAGGHVQVITFPFGVGAAWALPGGGMLLKREDKVLEMGEDASEPGQAGLWFLAHPDKEVVPVGMGPARTRGWGENDGADSPMGSVHAAPSGLDVLWVSEDEHPLLAVLDRPTASLIFYRWTRRKQPITLGTAPAPARDSSPEIIFAPRPRASRPSLARSRSSYAPQPDRRKSTGGGGPSTLAGRSPATKTRRVSGAHDGMPTSEGQTQANALRQVLEPPSGLPHVGAQPHVRMDVDPPGVTARGGRRSSHGHPGGGPSALGITTASAQSQRAPRLDMRDTTMLMGLEESEEEASTDMVLQEIHRWAGPELRTIPLGKVQYRSIPSGEIKVFMSGIQGHTANINVHVANATHKLFVFRYDPTSPGNIVTELQSYPVLSAAPVRCTEAASMDVAVTIAHSPHIHIIPTCGSLFSLGLPDSLSDDRDEMTYSISTALSMAAPEVHAGARSGTLVSGPAITSSTGSRLSVTLVSGRSVRVCVDLVPRDRMVRQALLYSRIIGGAPACDLVQRILFGSKALCVDFDALAVGLVSCVTGVQDSRPASSGAWAALQAATAYTSDQHLSISRRSTIKTRIASTSTSIVSPQSLEVMGGVLLAMHVLAEDCRMDSSRRSELFQAARVTARLAALLDQHPYLDHWLRIFPTLSQELPGPVGRPSFASPLPEPLDTFRLLDRAMRKQHISIDGNLSLTERCAPPYLLAQLCPDLRKMLVIYNVLFAADGLDNLSPVAAVERVVSLGFDEVRLRRLPWGFALPLYEAIRQVQDQPSKGLSIAAYALVQRIDLACMAAHERQGLGLDDGSVTGFPAEQRKTAENGSIEVSSLLEDICQETSHVVSPQQSIPQLRFTQDRRLKDVADMLQTTRKRVIRPEEKPNLNDYDLDNYYQTIANSIGMRTVASLPGKAIFTYGIHYADSTEIWPVPPLNLDVFLTIPKRTFSAKLAALHGPTTGWTGFNNGVAAALSIRRDCPGIDSSWIVFNKPETPTPEHGGFLFGLGLSGHLRSLVSWHAYPYLEPRHEFTTIGLLLGLAASYMGSQDKLLTKILSLNVQALLPEGSFDLNSPPSVQAASMLCVGLVYAGSGNSRIAEVALSQMAAKLEPGIEHHVDQREAYSFSAAMAFGLTMLGQGIHASGEMGTQLIGRVRHYVHGQPAAFESRNKDMSAEVDVNTTAPGATLALGLMYLRSHRADISAMIKLPETVYDLEHVRPDLLFVRSLSLGLINWNDVQPTTAWVRSCVPRFILAVWDARKGGAHVDELIELAFYHIVAGCCFVLGLRYASTLNQDAHAVLLHYHALFYLSSSQQSQTYEAKLRRSAIRQAFSISAVSLAMVVAGSGDLSVYRRLRLAHSQETNFGIRTAMHMAAGLVFLGAGKYSLGSSDAAIASMVIAFLPKFSSQVDDNRAYLQAYRHLWALAVEPRCFVTTDAHTLDKVYLPIKIKTKEFHDATELKSIQGISPTLLDTLDRVVSVTTQSPRYTTGLLDLSNREDRRRFATTQTLFVQRKAAFLDYFVDPKGYRTFQSFVAPFAVYGHDDAKDVPGWALSLSIGARDARLLAQGHATTILGRAFASRLIRVAGEEDGKGRFSLAAACERVLMEAIMNDREWLLPAHLAMLVSQGLMGAACGTTNVQQYIAARTCIDLSRSDLEKPYAIRNALVQRVALKAQRISLDSTIKSAYFAAARQGAVAAAAYATMPVLSVYLLLDRVPDLQLLQTIYERFIRFDRTSGPTSPTIADAQAAMIRLSVRDLEPPFPQTMPIPDGTSERDRVKCKANARAIVLQRLGHTETGWTNVADALKAWSQITT